MARDMHIQLPLAMTLSVDSLYFGPAFLGTVDPPPPPPDIDPEIDPSLIQGAFIEMTAGDQIASLDEPIVLDVDTADVLSARHAYLEVNREANSPVSVAGVSRTASQCCKYRAGF